MVQGRTGDSMARINQMSSGMRLFFARIFPLPFLLVGLLTLYFGVKGIYQARESTTWPVTDGTVQNSTMEFHSSSKGGGTYHAEVLYQFTVDGQTHSGNRVAFGDFGSSSPSHAQNIVNRYSKGKSVRVHYRMGDPDTCILEPGLHWQALFLPGFGLIFFVAGALMAIYLPNTMKESADQTAPPTGT